MSILRSSAGIAPTADAALAAAVPTRTGPYGEAYALNISGKEYGAADDGSYWMASNGTPGSGIIGTASIAAITAASPTFLVVNTHATKSLSPQFLHLHETVVSSVGARVQFTFYLDVINRYSSSGTALTINNVNTGATNTSGVLVYAGAIVAAAANAGQRLIDHVTFRGTIDVAEDEYEFVFGSNGGGLATGPQAATVQHFSATCPPVSIAPGHSMLMHQWVTGQVNAPTYLYRFGFILR